MSCTAEEIAAKKIIAQERLKAKLSVPSANSTTAPSNSAIKFISNIQFYGSNSTQSTTAKDSFKAKSSYANGSRVPPYKRNSEQKPTNIAPVFAKTISCTCAMLSESRFTVVPSSNHKALIDTFKTIPSWLFDSVNSVWSFSKSDYKMVQDRVSSLLNVTIGQIPKFVLNLINKPIMKNEMEAACLSAIEPTLVNSLLPFQKEGVCFGISKQGRCMIADEMGLGKTYQALAIADFYREEWPLLVCTTAGTRDSWADKVRELLPSVPLDLIHCMTSMQDIVSDATKVLIVSYNLMERSCEALLERKFRVIILDESHTVKNHKAKSTEAALQITEAAKRVILLTGTPALSRPKELYTQLKIIDRNFISFREYSLRYCEGKQTQYALDSNGQSNLPELNVVLKQKFMIRRTKQQVLTELANKTRETIMLDPALIWQNKETKENMASYAKDISTLTGAHKEVLLRYYSETSQAKVKAVCAYVRDLLLQTENKFIIFAHHKNMLNGIDECVSNLNVDHIRIDGDTQNNRRTALVNDFQTKSKCRVAVLSLMACNTGITLTAAQLVLFAELSWDPSTLAQAESRAHRLGQEGTVRCKYLLASGTSDDLMWEMVKSKQDVLSKAGLFNDDLADGTLVMGPVSGEKIDKYVVKTPRKNIDTSEPSGSANLSNMNVATTSNDLEELLDANDDDYFANLDY